MFPFTISYRIKIKSIEKIDGEKLFQIVQKELERLKVDKIVKEKNKILFKNSYFNEQGRNHLMASIDSGNFWFKMKTGELIYRFSLVRMCLIALGLATFLGLVSQKKFVFLLMVIWLLGANWLTSIIRQKMFINRLSKMIEAELMEN